MVTALFDGRCVICQTTRRIIHALDWFNRVEFVDLHNQALVAARYPDLDPEAMMGEIHVVAEDGLYAGFNGMRRMLRETPLGFPLWALLSLPGMGWAGPKIYRFIARNRYAINKAFGIDLQEDDNCVDGVCKLPYA
jgi:predicted DCC family thiol-disulfide oxidoreductase YuxK